MKVLFVGTYTGPKPVHGQIGGGQGIHVFQLNYHSGSKYVNLEPIKIIPCTQPSYICISDNRKWLYAVNTNKNSEENSINVFKIYNMGAGETKFIGNYNCKGTNACFVSQMDNYIFVANYGSGSAIAFMQNQQDGSLREVWFQEFSTDNRQSHIHCAVPHEENRLLYICDLGADKIYIMEIQEDSLKPFKKQPSISFPEGSGPRHVTFDQTGKFMYVSCELSNSVISFKIEDDQTVTQIQEPLNCVAENAEDYASFPEETFQSVADIHITPNGKYLYVSTRGKKNNIAIFLVNQTTGMLTLIGYESTRGRCPRNFTIDSSGTLLLCGNQDSDTIIPFEIENSGKLNYLGKDFECSAPVCLKIIDI